jgi:hypothetical protein
MRLPKLGRMAAQSLDTADTIRLRFDYAYVEPVAGF